MDANPKARLQVLGDFTDDDIITTMIHLQPGLRESLLLSEAASPESYDVARQSLRTSGFGDE
eukprot:938166-Prorocentrum_lima.AAC.1